MAIFVIAFVTSAWIIYPTAGGVKLRLIILGAALDGVLIVAVIVTTLLGRLNQYKIQRITELLAQNSRR